MSKSFWTEQARLIFLVGAPRSGTTWLQALIASHPCVSTGPETHFFEAIAPLVDFYQKPSPRPDGLKEYLSEEEFWNEIANLFHRTVSNVPPPERKPYFFLEKTPQHVFHIDIILRCFQEAYFIHLIRDPRDVVASILRAAKTWGKGWFPDSATIAAELWKHSVVEAKKISQKIKDPKRFFELRYEDLKADTPGKLAAIFDWLGLKYDNVLLQNIIIQNELKKVKEKGQFPAVKFPKKSGTITEPKEFFGAGKRDKKYLSLLQKLQVEHICADLLVSIGYEKRSPSRPLWATILSSWKLRKFLGLKPI